MKYNKMRKQTMKYIILILFTLAMLNCSMPSDKYDPYDGWSLEYQLEKYEAQFGSYSYHIDFMYDHWVCTIDLDDAVVLLYNNSGDDTPDWQTLLVIRG